MSASTSLVLHAGAAHATIEQVKAVATPPASAEWTPIPHHVLLRTVVGQLEATGMHVTDEAFALWQDGARFFSVISLRNGAKHDDYQLVVGLRNSHDKSFAAGIVCGSRVLICDNLAFSGEVKFSRKHTTNIIRDLPGLASRAVSRLHELRGFQDLRISGYKQHFMSDRDAHHFMIQTIEADILKPTALPHLLKEWRESEHEEFHKRDAWSLFNAYTETWKGALTALPRRTQTLHGMLDMVVGIERPKAIEEIEEADYEIVS